MANGRLHSRGWVAFALTLLVLAWSSAAARAESLAASPWAETDHGAVRLVSATTAVGDKSTLRLGLEFRLQDGWKIYWRNPGDAGYPPNVDWTGSTNLADASLAWPLPHRFTAQGFESIGYKHGVILPITATLAQPGEPLSLKATVDYLTCDDICVPYVAEIALDLPAGPLAASAHMQRIDRALAQVPAAGTAHGLAVNRVDVLGTGAETRLVVHAEADPPFTAPDVFIEGPRTLAYGAPEVALADDGRSARLTIPVFGGEGLKESLVGAPITVTLADTTRSTARSLNVMPPADTAMTAPGAVPPAAAPDITDGSFGLMLGLALLGGLILNLMPCVLPVLSLKLLNVVSHGGGARRTVRIGFIASSFGIVASFMVLAAALVALKASGAVIGWGLQFQQPWFLIAMVLVLTLFACNLWGAFEIPMPAFAGEVSARAANIRGLGGHVLTGALATLLATPCSAPFLGTAVGFALARGPAEIFAIFAALGLGLALPYLAVAAFPGLVTRLPRPGAWMGTVRKLLGLALAATVVWLLSVLATQLGLMPALALGALAAGLALLMVLMRAGGRRRPWLWAGAAVLAVAAFMVPSVSSTENIQASLAPETLWQPLDTARIPALVADGHTVFVNVTADWCLTCKANERFVLSREPVRSRLAAGAVIAMRGDWTRPNDTIAHYLASFGRYGIPFNAVYGPGLPEGQALPELLTDDIVLTALDRAAAPGEPVHARAQSR